MNGALNEWIYLLQLQAASVFVLCLQAGTYIKEFVHSDEGRTQPHLARLLGLSTSAAILQLDVNQIHIDFLQQ